MTKGLIVTFGEDLTPSEVERMQILIYGIKGVVSVVPVQANFDDLINRQRIRSEVLGKACEALRNAIENK